MPTGFNIQDTIRPKLVIKIDTHKLIPDSVFRRLDEVPAHIKYADSLKQKRKTSFVSEVHISDTTSVCSRNKVADITFYDSSGFARNLDNLPVVGIKDFFAENSVSTAVEPGIKIIRDLREGEALPAKALHQDWITLMIIVSAFLYLTVRRSSKSILSEMARFLLFRGVNESVSHNIGSLFTWQSTILNLVAFLITGLFFYCTAATYNLIPGSSGSFVLMLLCFLVVIIGVSSRHFICLAAGNLSGESNLFNEYLFTVYQVYRFSSVFLAAALILALYTVFLPAKVYIVSGIIILGIFYLYRVSRLLFIFNKRNISILYLILYLCALEILPVLILVKFSRELDL